MRAVGWRRQDLSGRPVARPRHVVGAQRDRILPPLYVEGTEAEDDSLATSVAIADTST
jgi:hypothetical protein